VTDLLTQMKGKIVASQEENVDRTKIQTDIDALKDQINAVTSAAQFNGLNMLTNVDTEAGSGTVNVLGSLDRSATGVTSTNISVIKQDLGTQAQVAAATMGTDSTVTPAVNDGATGNVAAFTTPTGLTGTLAGASYQYSGGTFGGIDIGGGANAITYVARDGDTLTDVASFFVDELNQLATEAGVDVTFAAGATAGTIAMTNNTGGNSTAIAANTFIQSADAANSNGTIGGGLADMTDIDVTTDQGTLDALENIEGLIQTSINAAAAFGSAQGRIETQATFISSLSDSLKSGIGSMVDANMEEASARLQALQVQQQLGVQALSIANQAPQTILSLFR